MPWPGSGGVTEHVYAPRGAALTLFSLRDDEVLLAGPAGTGKSRAVLERLAQQMMTYKGAKALIVRQTAVSLTTSALQTWERFVVPELMSRGLVTFFGGGPKEPPQYRFANGSTVAIGGMDKPTKVLSTEYDVIYVQEATEVSQTGIETLTTRMRSWTMPYSQLLMDCNPDAGTHHLKQRCNAGKTVLLHSRHSDNPELYGADGRLTPRGAAYMRRLDNLTGVRRLRLRDGLWVAAEGVIWESWDAGVHVVDTVPGADGYPAEACDSFGVPLEWRRIWGVDFGYSNPFVLQRWAIDPDGRAILYAETYRSGRLVEDHARDVMAEVAASGEPQPWAIVCDHDAEDRATLDRHLPFWTTKADKAVSVGIQVVEMRLRRAGDGQPRLYVLRGARRHAADPRLAERGVPTCTVEEIPGYRWDLREGKPPREEPVKENDHGCDTTRYVMMELDGGMIPTLRW